jgi:hypothetical protein
MATLRCPLATQNVYSGAIIVRVIHFSFLRYLDQNPSSFLGILRCSAVQVQVNSVNRQLHTIPKVLLVLAAGTHPTVGMDTAMDALY